MGLGIKRAAIKGALCIASPIILVAAIISAGDDRSTSIDAANVTDYDPNVGGAQQVDPAAPGKRPDLGLYGSTDRALMAVALPIGPPQQFDSAQVAIPRALDAPPKFRPIPFAEVHWQGLELIPFTPSLARSLGIDANVEGVIADDVTPPADASGFQGGDVIVAIGGIATPTIESVIDVADRVREQRHVEILVVRKNREFILRLWALKERLGAANGETAPMIAPGSRSPHGYQGRCTGCHRIGTKGQLPVDQGDLLAKTAPVIRANQSRPHRNRGNCTACHKILP